VLVVVHGRGAELVYPPAHLGCHAAGPCGAVRRPSLVADQRRHQPHDTVRGPPADPDRAEGGQRQNGDAVGGAGVRDDGSSGRLQWEIGHAHDQLPTLGQHPPPGGHDQRGQVGRLLHQPVDTTWMVQRPGNPRADPVGQVTGDVVGQVGGRTGGRDQTDDQLGAGSRLVGLSRRPAGGAEGRLAGLPREPLTSAVRR
jgi:hypothetical protein